VILLISVLSSTTGAVAADFQMEGRVVEYRTNTGIGGVTVTVKDRGEMGRILLKTTTGDSGIYTFKVSDQYAEVWIDYVPKDTKKYGTYGRSNVQNGAPDKKLDTVGLAVLSNAKDPSVVRAIGEGVLTFVVAGGGKDTARSVLDAAKTYNPSLNLDLRDASPAVFLQLQRADLIR
jgi:hypothetical protein